MAERLSFEREIRDLSIKNLELDLVFQSDLFKNDTDLLDVLYGKLQLGRPNDPQYPKKSKGSGVYKIQKALFLLGRPLPTYGIDGAYGDETYSAVLNYKRQKGIRTNTGYIDGIVGPKTIKYLDNELANTPTIVSRAIEFDIQFQQRTNWCWAAVAASVSRHFNSNTRWTQCQLANAEFSKSDCCNRENCDRGHNLELALKRTGNFKSISYGSGNLGHIIPEIDAGHPLCAKIEWRGGGSHAIVITGYNIMTDYIMIKDPIEDFAGKAGIWIPLSILQKNYQGIGVWIERYKVKGIYGS